MDTYDTLERRPDAIEVAHALGLTDRVGVRLDSGDLDRLAREARELLDAAGLTTARIFASGGLDEHEVAELVRGGAPVDAFGIGTQLGVSADAPYLDTVYKLVEYDGQPTMKLSASKVTAPGAKQVWRGPGEDLLGLSERGRSERMGTAPAPGDGRGRASRGRPEPRRHADAFRRRPPGGPDEGPQALAPRDRSRPAFRVR